jgi:hypothetical protein
MYGIASIEFSASQVLAPATFPLPKVPPSPVVPIMVPRRNTWMVISARRAAPDHKPGPGDSSGNPKFAAYANRFIVEVGEQCMLPLLGNPDRR